MALLGGGVGGAGNPVGGSFTGPAEALEIVGDHGLALSGLFSSNTSTYTMLNFTRVIIIGWSAYLFRCHK